MDTLELLELSKKYTVTKDQDDNSFDIESNEYDLAANISEQNHIRFYLTGCYNSGEQWLEINPKAFEELNKFCNLIIKQEEDKCSD